MVVVRRNTIFLQDWGLTAFCTVEVLLFLYYVTACLQDDTVKFVNIVKKWKEINDEFSR